MSATHDSGEVVTYLKEFLNKELGLELGDFDPEMPLFELGIHSINVIQLVRAIHDKYRVRIGIRELFQCNTVASLAAYIARTDLQ
jgi:acyl carrier protein